MIVFLSDMALYKVYSDKELEPLSISGLDAILMDFSAVPREAPGADQAYLDAARPIRKALVSKKKRKRQEDEEEAAMSNADAVLTAPEVSPATDSTLAAADEAEALPSATPKFGKVKDMSTFTPPEPTSHSTFQDILSIGSFFTWVYFLLEPFFFKIS